MLDGSSEINLKKWRLTIYGASELCNWDAEIVHR